MITLLGLVVSVAYILSVSELAKAFRQRFGPLIDTQRQRLSFIADKECKSKPTLQPWQLIRIIRGFDEDEQGLVAWMHRTAANELQPIICGYDELLSHLEEGDVEATLLARRLLHAELRWALSAMCERWMYRMLDRPQTPHPREGLSGTTQSARNGPE